MAGNASGRLYREHPFGRRAALALLEPGPNIRLGRANRLCEGELTAGLLGGAGQRFVKRAHTEPLYRKNGNFNRIYGRDGRLFGR